MKTSDIEDIATILLKSQVPQDVVANVVKELTVKIEQELDEKESRAVDSGAKSKKKFVIVLVDASGKGQLTADITKDVFGYAIQIDEDQNDAVALEGIIAGIKRCNDKSRDSKHRKKVNIKTLSEGISVLPRRYLVAPNGSKIHPKHKDPATVLVTDGSIG